MLAMQVLQRLAARRDAPGTLAFISGAELAREFGVTRSAIWKAISRLRGMGTQIDAVTHRGYRLAQCASPLDAAAVCEKLPADLRAALRDGGCEGEVDSTNSRLLARGAPPPGRFDFLTAEYQSAGRGRRGRSWLAPPGGAICLSWSWSFDGLPAAMGALSLAIGVAALRALRRLDIDEVQLKWPNDLLARNAKLGGILIEMRTESGGPVHVVLGLGLNVALPAALRASLAQQGAAAIDLATLCAPAPPPRPVTLQGSGAVESGVARGVDADGALRVAYRGQVHRIIAGEVSVRASAS